MTLPNKWVEKDSKISIVLTFTNYKHIFTILSMIADKAEEIDHHPTIKIDYLVVTIELTTYDKGYVVTDLDIQLAEYINRIVKI